jgi:hypothetical protein
MAGIREGSIALSCPRHDMAVCRTALFVWVLLVSSRRMSSPILRLPVCVCVCVCVRACGRARARACLRLPDKHSRKSVP